MLDNGKYTKTNESHIIDARDILVNYFLGHGYSVVVDDTNFNRVHALRLEKISKLHGAEFEERFINVEVEEAIKRDSKRTDPVGEKVIRDMYRQNIADDLPVEKSNNI